MTRATHREPGSALYEAGEWFTSPEEVNRRRYETLRAVFVDGLSDAAAGAWFGYSRWSVVNQVRDFRAGKLALFAPPGKPGPPPGVAPAKDRVRGRVIELRRQGLSTYEISTQLGNEGTPLNRTSVAEILTEEGFGRLLRHPAPEASVSPGTFGRYTQLPRASVIDFATWPRRVHTKMAGVLLTLPDLVGLDLCDPVRRAGYPSTRLIPATRWLLSLLALNLTGALRVSHVDDILLVDPAAALFARLATMPKKTALTDYSYRTSHNNQRDFLAALDEQMINAGLATADQAVFDLDFHAVMHCGRDPFRKRSVLTFFTQDSDTHNLVYTDADVAKTTQAREAIVFCDHWRAVTGHNPHMLTMDHKVTTHHVLGELDARGVKFITLRMRSESLMSYIERLARSDYKTIRLERPGPHHNRPRVNESVGVKLTRYPGTVRQLIVTGLGRHRHRL